MIEAKCLVDPGGWTDGFEPLDLLVAHDWNLLIRTNDPVKKRTGSWAVRTKNEIVSTRGQWHIPHQVVSGLVAEIPGRVDAAIVEVIDGSFIEMKIVTIQIDLGFWCGEDWKMEANSNAKAKPLSDDGVLLMG